MLPKTFPSLLLLGCQDDLSKFLSYRFIRQAKAARGKVLVHCKMGISRSASVVISYMMKEYEMDLAATIIRVKEKRSVVNPNKSFIKQLEVRPFKTSKVLFQFMLAILRRMSS